MESTQKRTLLVLSLLSILIVGLVIFFQKGPGNTNSKLKITASFYPLYEFAKQVGQDKVEVTNITPAGSEPHDFDPSPQDLARLVDSKVFIYNGAGLEPWVEKVIPDLRSKSITIVEASQSTNLLTLQPEEVIEPVYDPHFWLDPNVAIKEVGLIRDALVKSDPSNKEYYNKNALLYQEKLGLLAKDFEDSLKDCKRREIFTSHAAFGYLSKSYNLKMVSVSGLSPDEEPSPSKLALVAKLAREIGVKYIFFETLVSPKLSEAVAKEIGAKTLVFNPLEGLTSDEIKSNKDYVSTQRENLRNLKIALECK